MTTTTTTTTITPTLPRTKPLSPTDLGVEAVFAHVHDPLCVVDVAAAADGGLERGRRNVVWL